MRYPSMGLIAMFVTASFAALASVPSSGASSCTAPEATTDLAGKSFATGTLSAGQSDFYAVPPGNNTTVFASTEAEVGGSIEIWVYQDCSHWSCGFWSESGVIPVGLGGGGACWGTNFHPTVFEVRFHSASIDGRVRYAVHVDDCTEPSLNGICRFIA